MSAKYTFGGLGNPFKCKCGNTEFVRAENAHPENIEIYECTNYHEWYTEPVFFRAEKFTAKIILGNGESMDIESDNLEALVANGLLEVIERNEAGLPIKVRI